MGVDWQTEFDRSITAGVDRPASDYVPAGRRAVRRRRTAMGAGALATALVVGGLTWAASPESTRAVEPPAVTSPTASGSPTASTGPKATEAARTFAPVPSKPADVRVAGPREERSHFVGGVVPVSTTGEGGLIVKRGWEATHVRVLEVDESTDPDEMRREWGLIVRGPGGEEVWALVDWTPASSGVASDPAGKGGATFEEWLGLMQGLQEEPAETDLVRMLPDGTLEAATGVTILEQRTGLDLGPGFADLAAGDRAAAVRVLADGEELLVLVREVDGSVEVIPTFYDSVTMDEFVSQVRLDYASGEGLR